MQSNCTQVFKIERVKSSSLTLEDLYFDPTARTKKFCSLSVKSVCHFSVMDYTVRSNSSAPLRAHLKSNLASLPDISNKVTVTSYIRYCHNLYTSAQSAYNQGDLRRAYVDLYKFQILAITKIPTHKDYKSKAPIAIKARAWLESTRVPAIKLLEIVVYRLDFEEDQRVKHSVDFDLMDEFEREDVPESEPEPETAPDPAVAPTTVFTGPRDSSKLNILHQDISAADTSLAVGGPGVVYAVPEIAFPEDLEVVQSAAALSTEEKAILNCIGDYQRFVIPQPSQTTIDVTVGQKHYFFHQDDFHTSFAGFLTGLPPELQLAKSAVEMNRCFFIHLGIAISIHPFALECAFRHMAAAASETAEEWQKEILASVGQYGALVDANMLCFLWPRELNPYRICFVSGTLAKPLVSCFEPPPSALRGASAEDLTEVIIRCSGDHFTLLRPMQEEAKSPKGFKVISRLLADAKAAKLVSQVSPAREPDRERSLNAALSQLY